MAPKDYALDPEAFFEDVLDVSDRDSESIVDFKLRFAQKAFFAEVQRARALNIFLTAARSGASGVLALLLGDVAPRAAGETIPEIVKFGVDRMLKKLFDKGFTKVSDGPLRFCLLKARRMGFSSLIAAFALWASSFRDNLKTCVVAHEGAAAANLLDLTSTFYDFWDTGRVTRPDLEGDSKTVLEFSNRSRYQVKPAGAKEIRSFQFSIIHLSEFAFYDNAASIGAALMGAPKHSWIFIESTANGPGGPFYDKYNEAVELDQVIAALDAGKPLRAGVFIKHFASWIDDEDYSIPIDTPAEEEEILATLSDYEKSLFARFPDKMSAARIKWHRFIKENANHDSLTREQFMLQEYPATAEEAFQNSGDRPFDVTKQRPRAKQAAEEAFYFEVTAPNGDLEIKANLAGATIGTNLAVYAKPKKKKHYIVAADVAKGLKHRDATVIAVFDRGDGIRLRQVAEVRCWLDQTSAAHLAVMLAEWYNNAFIIQEINEATLFAAVISDVCGYSNFYIRETFDAVVAQSKNAFRYGFLTSPSTKKMIIEALRNAFHEDLIYLCSPQGVKECDIFTRDDKGHYGAPPGQHDDCVIAYALAWFAASSGKAPSLPAPTRTADGEIENAEAASQKEEAYSRLDAETLAWITAMRDRDRAADQENGEDFLSTEQILLKNPNAAVSL